MLRFKYFLFQLAEAVAGLAFLPFALAYAAFYLLFTLAPLIIFIVALLWAIRYLLG